MSDALAKVKMAGAGTNPRIYSNGAMLAALYPNFYFVETTEINPWSIPYDSADGCFAAATKKLDERKALEAKSKKR